MGRWDGIDSWSGGEIRREVFFFPCGGAELYGSLYAASPLRSGLGVAMCNSWGIEGDQTNRLMHPLAVRLAKAGGAGLVFHYPGVGDSGGNPEATTMEAMAEAALSATREGARRLPGSSWLLAGFMLGAAVACLALERVRPEALLMVQPSLSPSRYFERLQRRAKRIAALSRSGDETVFGYTLSEPLLASAAEADATVPAALAAFAGPGAIVRYSSPRLPEPAPQQLERIEVEGTWQFGSRDNAKLGAAAGEWLTRYMRDRDDARAA